MAHSHRPKLVLNSLSIFMQPRDSEALPMYHSIDMSSNTFDQPRAFTSGREVFGGATFILEKISLPTAVDWDPKICTSPKVSTMAQS